jgi:hypothetical protein
VVHPIRISRTFPNLVISVPEPLDILRGVGQEIAQPADVFAGRIYQLQPQRHGGLTKAAGPGPGYFGPDIDGLTASRVFHPEDASFAAVSIPVEHVPRVGYRQADPSGGQVLNKHGDEVRGFALLPGNL